MHIVEYLAKMKLLAGEIDYFTRHVTSCRFILYCYYGYVFYSLSDYGETVRRAG